MNGIQEEHERKVRKLEAEMMQWAEGERSHWNYYNAAYPGDPGRASVLCTIADAAEVQKLSAAIVALNSRRVF